MSTSLLQPVFVTLEECAVGAVKVVEIKRNYKCKGCDGSGEEAAPPAEAGGDRGARARAERADRVAPARAVAGGFGAFGGFGFGAGGGGGGGAICHRCGGGGCDRCGGMGFVREGAAGGPVKCGICDGKRVTEQAEDVDITIRAGMRDGDLILVPDMETYPAAPSGAMGMAMRAAGMPLAGVPLSPMPVVLRVTLLPHPVYVRVHDHLLAVKRVSLEEALVGTTFTLPHPAHAQVVVTLPPLVALKKAPLLRVAGAGLPVYAPSTTGWEPQSNAVCVTADDADDGVPVGRSLYHAGGKHGAAGAAAAAGGGARGGKEEASASASAAAGGAGGVDGTVERAIKTSFAGTPGMWPALMRIQQAVWSNQSGIQHSRAGAEGIAAAAADDGGGGVGVGGLMMRGGGGGGYMPAMGPPMTIGRLITHQPRIASTIQAMIALPKAALAARLVASTPTPTPSAVIAALFQGASELAQARSVFQGGAGGGYGGSVFSHFGPFGFGLAPAAAAADDGIGGSGSGGSKLNQFVEAIKAKNNEMNGLARISGGSMSAPALPFALGAGGAAGARFGGAADDDDGSSSSSRDDPKALVAALLKSPMQVRMLVAAAVSAGVPLAAMLEAVGVSFNDRKPAAGAGSRARKAAAAAAASDDGIEISPKLAAEALPKLMEALPATGDLFVTFVVDFPGSLDALGGATTGGADAAVDEVGLVPAGATPPSLPATVKDAFRGAFSALKAAVGDDGDAGVPDVADLTIADSAGAATAAAGGEAVPAAAAAVAVDDDAAAASADAAAAAPAPAAAAVLASSASEDADMEDVDMDASDDDDDAAAAGHGGKATAAAAKPVAAAVLPTASALSRKPTSVSTDGAGAAAAGGAGTGGDAAVAAATADAETGLGPAKAMARTLDRMGVVPPASDGTWAHYYTPAVALVEGLDELVEEQAKAMQKAALGGGGFGAFGGFGGGGLAGAAGVADAAAAPASKKGDAADADGKGASSTTTSGATKVAKPAAVSAAEDSTRYTAADMLSWPTLPSTTFALQLPVTDADAAASRDSAEAGLRARGARDAAVLLTSMAAGLASASAAIAGGGYGGGFLGGPAMGNQLLLQPTAESLIGESYGALVRLVDLRVVHLVARGIMAAIVGAPTPEAMAASEKAAADREVKAKGKAAAALAAPAFGAGLFGGGQLFGGGGGGFNFGGGGGFGFGAVAVPARRAMPDEEDEEGSDDDL